MYNEDFLPFGLNLPLANVRLTLKRVDPIAADFPGGLVDGGPMEEDNKEPWVICSFCVLSNKGVIARFERVCLHCPSG